mgnify:CR=1 FL=1
MNKIFSLKNSYRLVLYFACFLLFYIYFTFPNDYIASHYFFNYEFEYMNRGLIGEFLRLSNIEPLSPKFYFFFVISYFLLSIIIIETPFTLKQEADFYIKLFLLSLPSVTNFYRWSGYFDYYLLSFSILFLILSVKTNFFRKYYFYLFFIFGTILCLIHEIYIFFHAPIMIYLGFIIKAIKNFFLKYIIYLTIFSLFNLYLATQFGSIDHSNLIKIFEIIELSTGIYKADLYNFLKQGHGLGLFMHLFDASVLLKNITIFTLLLGINIFYFFVISLFLIRILSIDNFERVLLLFSIFFPLICFLIASDHARFYAATLNNFLIMVIYIGFNKNGLRYFNDDPLLRLTLVFGIFLNLLIGPLGLGFPESIRIPGI